MTHDAPRATGDEWLAHRFDEQRGRLHAVAARILGDGAEAEDAVQEAWLRLQRTGPDGIDNLSGWLTTVVSRVCLDHLRSRAARREDAWAPVEEVAADHPDPRVDEPEDAAVQADALGAALQLVLDTLTPAERLAFVLHDLFGVPFDEIAPVVERTPEATRQLASRARRRVRGGSAAGEGSGSVPGRARQREVVEAFLAASREGDFERLVALLAPDAELRADAVAVAVAQGRVELGAPPLVAHVRGAREVASVFSGRARAARLAIVDGAFGAVWAPGGQVRSVFAMRVEGDRVVEVSIHVDAAVVAAMDVELV